MKLSGSASILTSNDYRATFAVYIYEYQTQHKNLLKAMFPHLVR